MIFIFSCPDIAMEGILLYSPEKKGEYYFSGAIMIYLKKEEISDLLKSKRLEIRSINKNSRSYPPEFLLNPQEDFDLTEEDIKNLLEHGSIIDGNVRKGNDSYTICLKITQYS